MSKKYFLPASKPIDNKETNGASGGSSSRRKLSAKSLIIILSIILVVCVAVVVPVCVVYVDIPVKAEFLDFDQKNDYWLVASWNSVAAAQSYDVEYCFEDPVLTTTVITKGNTKNKKFYFERSAGSVYFRVRAVKGERKGKYSDWIEKEIDAWTLSKPVVTVNTTTMQISWTPVTYRYEYDYSKIVSAYVYQYAWKPVDDEDDKLEWRDDKSLTNYVRLDSSLLTLSEYFDYQFNDHEWPGDVTLYFRVAAVNHGYSTLGGFSDYVGDTPEELALRKIYNDVGEYGETSVTITKEIFDALSK